MKLNPALQEYWKLRKQGKVVNALDIRCACGLRKVGPYHFIFDGKAVIIKGAEDPHGREWGRLKDLITLKLCRPKGRRKTHENRNADGLGRRPQDSEST